jgi:hypothetical protein
VKDERRGFGVRAETMDIEQDDVVIAGREFAEDRAVEPQSRTFNKHTVVVADTQSVPAKRSPFLLASRWQTASCPSARTLRPRRGRCRSTGQVVEVCCTVVEVCCTHTDAIGGATDTEVNELAANPTGLPSTTAHTAATPEGKQPNACRS